MNKQYNTDETISFLNDKINTSKGNTIDVFPLPCGAGKTTYIKQLICNTLEHGGNGFIVVTDSIDRLDDYIINNNDGCNLYLRDCQQRNLKDDNELESYISRNVSGGKIAILKSDTVKDEMKTINYKPIVLLTTQRYFSMTKEEINDLTEYEYGIRDKIIFDEKPYFIETREIDIEILNDIDTALQTIIDNTYNTNTKDKIVLQFQELRNILQEDLKANQELLENSNKENEKLKQKKNQNYYDFYPPIKRSVSANNENDIDYTKYISLINEILKSYGKELKSQNYNIYKDIKAVKQLLNESLIISYIKANRKDDLPYRNYFFVFIDNSELLTDINAKIIILDGTADISPEYKLKYLNVVDCNEFKKDLSNLTIKIVKTNTSKTSLQNDKENIKIKGIIDYIKAQLECYNTIFTYKNIADKFKKSGFANVDYFGNIKGKNIYNTECNIAQVGLLQYPEQAYIMYANVIGQRNDICQQSIGLDCGSQFLNRRIYDQIVINNIKYSQILSDIEQNLYRSKIRNSDNKDKITYMIFFDIGNHNKQNKKLYGVSDFDILTNLIKKRYEKYGAKIVIDETAKEIKFNKIKRRKSKNETYTQKFIDWYNQQPKGRYFKRSDILKECDITESQFKKIKKSNLLNDCKTDKTTLYIIK